MLRQGAGVVGVAYRPKHDTLPVVLCLCALAHHDVPIMLPCACCYLALALPFLQPTELVARAAELGEMGDVDAALEVTKQAEAVGRQHDTLYKQLTEPERTMTVCDICGVFINSTDNEQRRLVSGLVGRWLKPGSPSAPYFGSHPTGGVLVVPSGWCSSSWS